LLKAKYAESELAQRVIKELPDLFFDTVSFATTLGIVKWAGASDVSEPKHPRLARLTKTKWWQRRMPAHWSDRVLNTLDR